MQLPLMIEMTDKKILVVGGGAVGLRKISQLLKYGAVITCVSIDFCDGLKKLEMVRCIQSSYDKRYLGGNDLIIAATDSPTINGKIYKEAKGLHKLCMTVDAINPSDFSFMAVKENKGLLLGVSTQGGSPVFAKEMATQLMNQVSDEQFEVLARMIKERQARLLEMNEV